MPSWTQLVRVHAVSLLYVCVCMCVFVPLLCNVDKGVLVVRKYERIEFRSPKVLKKLWRLCMSPGQMYTKSTGHARGWWTK